ncbi:MAG TPA: universal stress protein [Candidatus Sulfotelmatobacter sp.]|nr:universal stress protein [Candidatus Sulfotelmatobacter sp.]
MAAVTQIARISLKNILFPTDFSQASVAALPFAASLARLYGSTVQVAHVILPEPRHPIVVDRIPAQDDLVWEDARGRLEDFIHVQSLDGIHCRALLAAGDLAEAIPVFIREHAIDLVIVGTHGRTGVSKMMMGSDAERVYRSASCPVLTVGPRAHNDGWKLQRILCPVENTENPGPALRYALSLAEENQAEIIVMQAIPLVPWQHRNQMERQAWERLRNLIPAEAGDWCNPQLMVRWEDPPEAILQTAQEQNADLIVMGVRQARATALSSHMPWPVASEVVSRAPCPVLTIRV